MDKTVPKYIGYKKEDFNTPYASFYDETFAAVSPEILRGVKNSPVAVGQLPSVAQATTLLEKGYQTIENGYSLEADGSARVAVLTPMPNVAPYMWDWWFGWHGCKANRYKLWHPRAHLDAQWQDGDQEREAYIGRTSMIEEYIGESLEKANIRFISPTELGFKEADLKDKSEVVFICARIGYTHFPLDFGYLVHQIRRTEGGAEMRSRFWMGGEYIALRGEGTVPKMVSKLLQKLKRIPKQQAIDLMLHCTEEMNHLAAFLPNIYHQFNKPV
ncbi:MAG: hypothetical protein JNL70_08450 [Saprospiraceae bacterium]|nr:hypothetical protein [Saprospiraceae bacterium]